MGMRADAPPSPPLSLPPLPLSLPPLLSTRPCGSKKKILKILKNYFYFLSKKIWWSLLAWKDITKFQFSIFNFQFSIPKISKIPELPKLPELPRFPKLRELRGLRGLRGRSREKKKVFSA
jgi:hypothetical protein